jgi:hypothetical protein
MIESILQTFLLLATFDTILISVSIANFAVSASYLGRETRLTRWRMEKRKQKLSERIKELQNKGLSIEDLKKETKEAENDINALGTRIFFLSWLGAVVFPSIMFIISLIFALLGMNIEILLPNGQAQGLMEQNLLATSAATLGFGFFILLLVIAFIDSAARRLPIPEFDVYFEPKTDTLKMKRKERRSIEFSVHNRGEDIAQNLQIFVNFPPVFKLYLGSYDIVKQTTETDFPNYNAAVFKTRMIHVDTITLYYLDLEAPDEIESYDIPVYIYERKTGLTKYKIAIQVID